MPTVRTVRVVTSDDESAAQPPPTKAQALRLIQKHKQAIADLQEYIAVLAKVELLHGSNGVHNVREPRRNPAAVKKVGAPTGLLQAVRNLAPKLPQPFTINDFLGKLNGVQFKGDEKAAVRDAIYTLKQKEVFKLVEPGRGGSPNKYEVVRVGRT
jgi:hypothetical protein